MGALEEKGLLASEKQGSGRREFLEKSAMVAAIPIITSAYTSPASAGTGVCLGTPNSSGTCDKCGDGAPVAYNPFVAGIPIPGFFNCCPCEGTVGACDCASTAKACTVVMQIYFQLYRDASGNFIGWGANPSGRSGSDDTHQFWECLEPGQSGGGVTSASDCVDARNASLAATSGYNPMTDPLTGDTIHIPAGPGVFEFLRPTAFYACCSIQASAQH